MQVRAVRSVDEEDAVMGRCSCGNSWALARNAVSPRSGVWLDVVGMLCQSCGSRAEFAFDVTSFFEARPGVWRAEARP